MNHLWSEIKIEIPTDMGELVAEIFQEEGAGGTVFDDPDILAKVVLQHDEVIGEEVTAGLPGVFGLRAYLPVDDRLGERLIRLKEKLTQVLGKEPALELRRIREEDWAEAWKTYFKVEKIGRVVIKPSWEEYLPESNEAVIDLDPGMAFGTGTHPTTRLCLKLLQDLVHGQTRVLDVGTGSGILAIAAAQLGALQVVASDVDPLAVRVAGENVARNGLAKEISVLEGDLLQLPVPGKFDLMVANIIADIILKLIPDVERFLAPEGRFLASGIIAERAADIKAKLAESGYSICCEMNEDGWVALVAARK